MSALHPRRANANHRLDRPAEIVQVPIAELHPDPANPRKISDSELDVLTRSLREFGFVQPVLARRDDRTVGQTIREVRRARGVSQERLAFASGPDRTFVGAVERGIRNPSLLSVFAQADALNVDVRDFFAPATHAPNTLGTPREP